MHFLLGLSLRSAGCRPPPDTLIPSILWHRGSGHITPSCFADMILLSALDSNGPARSQDLKATGHRGSPIVAVPVSIQQTRASPDTPCPLSPCAREVATSTSSIESLARSQHSTVTRPYMSLSNAAECSHSTLRHRGLSLPIPHVRHPVDGIAPSSSTGPPLRSSLPGALPVYRCFPSDVELELQPAPAVASSPMHADGRRLPSVHTYAWIRTDGGRWPPRRPSDFARVKTLIPSHVHVPYQLPIAAAPSHLLRRVPAYG
ncbi:hypothetical protein K466DRAFT_139937 [Polyporus arcularius HHB13444]|uniref:Uncharacterized protein n=1 Tax=Polyporus arcularius HHB13444 TaxID=1314778 RepID=A0A5C3PBW0_9APHY|nr:hypothetical protein K466DRAFT_139937 [Polyporus arcularius HHB13444]